jgi:hypothetical protein
MKRPFLLLTLWPALLLFLLVAGCGKSGGHCPSPNLDIAVCDPGAGPFSLTIDNDFFPLEVGSQFVLEDEGATSRVEISVLDETEEIAGVTTRVVRSTEYEDGELIEDTRDYFAQAPDGTVCYFGEDVDIYKGGEVTSHKGSWRAGVNGNLPGIQMPADPAVGMVFRQEFASGVAEDIAEVTALGEQIDIPAGMFDDTLSSKDCNPLESGAKDTKVYIRGIGLAIDEDAELLPD